MARSSRSLPPPSRAVTLQVVGTAALSWLGLFVHNVADLPGQTVFSLESAGPALFTILLVALWLFLAPRLGAWLLLIWAWINLVVGAVLSVLPFPLFPFTPEQSLRHYAFHALYGVLQIPAILVMTRNR